MTQSSAAPPAPIRPPQFFEFSGELVVAEAAGALSPGWRLSGEHSWTYRAQNFTVTVSWLNLAQEVAEPRLSDESLLLIMDGAALEVSVDGSEPIEVADASVVVVPPGALRLRAAARGYIVRVLSAREAEPAHRALNARTYATPDPAVRALPDSPPLAGEAGLRVHRLSDVRPLEGRFGRIFRTGSLMVNWFEPHFGPRDTDRLTPHAHDDFEQATVTMAGDYVHHIRRPWTERLRDWRADEHVHVQSPSVTIIPPGNIHTTRAIGEGVHHLIDVFAPVREDFVARGWVINQRDYDASERNAQ